MTRIIGRPGKGTVNTAAGALASVHPTSMDAAAVPAALAPYVVPVLLLFGSNVFMTFAWYGHLKYKSVPLLAVILVSWLIALPEYALQVPANRMGHAVYSAVQLKTLQEVITLLVFIGFSTWYLGEPIRWNHLAGFGLMVAAVSLIFMD